MTMNVGIGIAFIVVAVLILFADDISYALHRVGRFQRKPLRSSIASFPAFKFWKKRQRFKADPLEIRDFAVNLQLAASLEETLSGGLIEAAEQFADRGIFGQRLKRQVESRLTISPEEAIKGLAEDFQSEELRDLLRILEIAREQGASTAEALAVSVEAMESDIETKVKRDIQRAPIVLTIPMVVGVFFAALILAAYPLLVSMFETLTRYH